MFVTLLSSSLMICRGTECREYFGAGGKTSIRGIPGYFFEVEKIKQLLGYPGFSKGRLLLSLNCLVEKMLCQGIYLAAFFFFFFFFFASPSSGSSAGAASSTGGGASSFFSSSLTATKSPTTSLDLII